jgi:transposase
MTYVGIDIHKKQFTVCYRELDSTESFRQFPNDSEGFDAFMDTVTCFDRLAIESISFSRPFYQQIVGRVREVVLVDTAKFSFIAKSNRKTDKHDASMLAMGLAKDILPRARFRSEASQQVRSLLTVRRNLVNQKVRLVINAYSMLSRIGMHINQNVLAHKGNRRKINTSSFGEGDKVSWEFINNHLVKIQDDIYTMSKKIEEMAEQFEGHDILRSIPGIGPITAATLISYIDDVNDFRNAKALCSYFGIVPRTRLSDGHPVPAKFGKFRSGAITKTGCTHSRTAITQHTN